MTSCPKPIRVIRGKLIPSTSFLIPCISAIRPASCVRSVLPATRALAVESAAPVTSCHSLPQSTPAAACRSHSNFIKSLPKHIIVVLPIPLVVVSVSSSSWIHIFTYVIVVWAPSALCCGVRRSPQPSHMYSHHAYETRAPSFSVSRGTPVWSAASTHRRRRYHCLMHPLF